MLNHDEPILRSRTIDPAAPFPIVHQAIRIALYEEFAARSFDARVVEAFGPRAPFPELVRADEQRIAALSGLCQRFGIPRPLDPFPQETRLEPSWLATCARAVAGRIATAQRYGALLARVAEPEVRNVFLQLQSTSIGQHLPTLRQAVADAVAQERYHAARGIPPQQAYARHGPLSDFLEKAFAQIGAQAGPLGLFSPLLRHAHPALLAGMVAGATGVYLMKNPSARNRKEN
ncbi:MAG: ferritin [Burkholderiaceae bacterium]|nr:ferritin [Burkholderiaceae bacterium]